MKKQIQNCDECSVNCTGKTCVFIMLQSQEGRIITAVKKWGFFRNEADIEDAKQTAYLRMLERKYTYTGNETAIGFYFKILKQVCCEMVVQNKQFVHLSQISNSIEFQEVFLEVHLKDHLKSEGIDVEEFLRYSESSMIDITDECIRFIGKDPSESRDYRQKQMKSIIDRIESEEGFRNTLFDHVCRQYLVYA